jgi:hypothetical protein
MDKTATPSPEAMFPIELNDGQLAFLLYTLGYMLAAADRMSEGHRELIQRRHYEILPKLVNAKCKVDLGFAEMAEMATQLCVLAQTFPECPDQAKMVELSAALHNQLAGLKK